MATIKWAELCDHVLVESSGKISVIGMFDGITARSFPAEHPDLWVVVKFEGFPGEKVGMEIDFVGPDGELRGHAAPIEGIVSSGGLAVLAARIFRPVFPKPGPYQIRIRPSVGQAATLRLTILQMPAEPQQQG